MTNWHCSVIFGSTPTTLGAGSLEFYSQGFNMNTKSKAHEPRSENVESSGHGNTDESPGMSVMSFPRPLIIGGLLEKSMVKHW